jgi:TPP-dependent pyruvate/acetoin dehydrogenase alpha subunit
MGAHSTSDDPSRYRDEKITEAWKDKDPIDRLRTFLIHKAILDDDQAQELQKTLFAEIRQVLAKVEAAPASVPLGTMFDDVFAVRPPFLVEQAAQAARFEHAADQGAPHG